jgi:multiple sugar transport system substrate-binding protein
VKRATMMNGLADSITKNAHNKAGAEKWVKYLASDEVPENGRQLRNRVPCDPGRHDTAVAAYKKKGIDVTAFTKPVADKKDFTTFSYPITNYAADVYALMHPAMQDVYANDAPVSGLTKTNKQINFILGQ